MVGQKSPDNSISEFSRCRRERPRTKVFPREVKCWDASSAPQEVTLIEADTLGARAVLPINLRAGDQVTISFKNKLGQFRTRQARVAWTQAMTAAPKVIAGLAFDEDLTSAA